MTDGIIEFDEPPKEDEQIIVDFEAEYEQEKAPEYPAGYIDVAKGPNRKARRALRKRMAHNFREMYERQLALAGQLHRSPKPSTKQKQKRKKHGARRKKVAAA